MRPRSHLSVFVWKRNFFVADTASVHTYPMKTVTEDATFWKRSSEWNFLKTPFFRVSVWTVTCNQASLFSSRLVRKKKIRPRRKKRRLIAGYVDGGKRNFSKTMTYQYWIQSSRAKENGGKWWFYVSALHKAARKYVRMPKVRAKLLCYSFLLEIDTAQQTDLNQSFPSLQLCTRWWLLERTNDSVLPFLTGFPDCDIFKQRA